MWKCQCPIDKVKYDKLIEILNIVAVNKEYLRIISNLYYN